MEWYSCRNRHKDRKEPKFPKDRKGDNKDNIGLSGQVIKGNKGNKLPRDSLHHYRRN
jgi:hypothetical protein